MAARSRFHGALVVLLVVGTVAGMVGPTHAAGPTSYASLDGSATSDDIDGPSSPSDVDGAHAQVAGSFEERTFEGRDYLAYVPSGPAPEGGYPVVVMLHGCDQTPRGFDDATGMSRVAEEEGFVVVYPDQRPQDNAFECWNWFQPDNYARGAGEARLIAGMTWDAIQHYETDRRRVYIAGISSGGAMATNLAGEYPDLYAAVGSHSGLEYHAVEDPNGAIGAQQSGGIDPADRAQKAYRRAGDDARPIPAIVFQGTGDAQVNKVNGNQTAAWAIHLADLASDGSDDGDIDTDPETVESATTDGGMTYRRFTYALEGTTMVEFYRLDGARHGWSGGNASVDYTIPEGPDATRRMWDFFADHAHPNSTFDGPAASPTTAAPTPTATDTPATPTATPTETTTAQPGTEPPSETPTETPSDAPITESPTTTSPSDGGGPGFGVVVALAALAAATLALLARRGRES